MSMCYIRSNSLLHQKTKNQENKKKKRLRRTGFQFASKVLFFWFVVSFVFFGILFVFCFFGFLVF